ncbi:MAG: DNA recombination protein RmuC [Clostridia bacterium]|nr:DNA recombination protein RmuC [Clostridia bacterium]
MIEWINMNPGVSSVIAILICFLPASVFLSLMLKKQARKNASMIRRLDERVNGGNSRLRASVHTINQVMGNAAMNLNSVSESMEARQERMRREMEEKLELIRVSNETKLEEVRLSLGTSVQKTLESRLGESFRLVSGQLESVYKGLGEMKTLAEGVGDLKRVLSGVKTRGVWGEVRLRAILSDALTSSQYQENVCVQAGSLERVEFAVRLPGTEENSPVWLPIDSKFPMEDYQRLVLASENGEAKEVQKCAQQLESAVIEQAKRISSKYIRVPNTTDFAVMFLPVESLYGEILSRRGLSERLQRDFHVLPAGPSSLQALINCLQMGFRTVAMEKRSGEILRMLGGVKQEFMKFGDTLSKARTRLEQAAGDLDSVGVRTRALNKKLIELEMDAPAVEIKEDQSW